VAFELFVSRRAAREIDRVAAWWAAHRPAAPGAVRKDLEAAFSLLIEQPRMGGEVTQASSPGVRRFHVDRIGYWVYYRVRGTRLEVVSVWHSSRGSGPSV
jgi:plasmid stabilization system protein ParE